MVAQMTRARPLDSSVLPVIGAVLAVVLILHHHDVAYVDLAKFAAYIGLVVAAPGVFAWRLLLANLHHSSHAGGGSDTGPRSDRPGNPTWFEDVSLGAIFGFAVQLPVYLLGVWVGAPLLFLVLPVMVGVASVTKPGRRVWALPTERVDVRVSWCLSAVAVYAVAWLARRVFYVQPLTLPLYRAPHLDESFHEALISELLHRFPPQVPFLLGTRLDYHWFVHAQLAADHWATRLSTTMMLRELMPATVAALTVAGLGAVALRLTGRPVAAVVAPALLVAGGFGLMGPHFDWGNFSESYLSRRFVSSPSQAYGFMMALPATMLVLEVLRPSRRAHVLTWVAMTLALFGLSGSKATFLPIFLCGAVAVVVFQLAIVRTLDKTAVAMAAILSVVTAFAQIVLLGGSSGAMSFSPLLTPQRALQNQGLADGPALIAVMTVTLLVGWLLYGVGVFGLVHDGTWRDRRALWMLFSVPVGVAVALTFFRSGLSQLWFQRSVAELVVLLSAWGLARMLPDPVPRRLGLRLTCVAAAAGLVAFLVSSRLESVAAGSVTGNLPATDATTLEVVATAATPFAVAGAYVVVWLAARRVGVGPRITPVVPLVFLLGLGLTHVFSLAYDTVSMRSLPSVNPTAEFAQGGIAAARWIADHSQPDDIVATNVHSRFPKSPKCDKRSFWVAAFTERRVVVEGWGYTEASNEAKALGGCRNVPNPPALKVNNAAFRRPSVRTVDRLVKRYDVSYLFVSKAYQADVAGLRSLPSVLRLTYHNANYLVFKVLDRP
jgi:hypothetical protein